MGHPNSPLSFGIPRRSGDNRLWTRYPQGDAPNAGSPQGLGASATAAASLGSATGGSSGDIDEELGPYSGLVAGLQEHDVYSMPIDANLPHWGTSGGSEVEFVSGDWYDGSNSVKLYPPTIQEDSGLGSMSLGLSSGNQIRAYNFTIEVKFGSAFCATALNATPKWAIVHCAGSTTPPGSPAARPMLYMSEFVESDTSAIHLPETYALSAGQATVDVWGPDTYNDTFAYPTVWVYPGQRQPFYFGQTAGVDGAGNPIVAHDEIFTVEMRTVCVSTHPGLPSGYIGWRVYRRNGQVFERGTSYTIDGDPIDAHYIYELQQFGGGYYNIGRPHNANHYIHLGGRLRMATNFVGWIGPRAGFYL